jgi:hypothetical protein
MPLEHITDHADRAEARLITQYKGKPNMVAAVRAFASEMQAAEDALWQVYEQRSIENAVGVQLDGLGRIVGVQRQGRGDETFRLYIRVTRLLNRSSGTIPELLKMFGLIADPLGLSVVLEEQFPAALVLRIGAGPLAAWSDFLSILHKGKAAGVRAVLEWSGSTPSNTFSFRGGHGRGFGTLSNPGHGGHFAEART